MLKAEALKIVNSLQGKQLNRKALVESLTKSNISSVDLSHFLTQVSDYSVPNKKYPFEYLINNPSIIEACSYLKGSADKTLYRKVVKNAPIADKISNCFKVLQAAGISPQTHNMLYSEVISTLSDMSNLEDRNDVVLKLSQMLKALQEAGANLTDNIDLYVSGIEQVKNVDKLTAGFNVLKRAGATPQVDQKLYKLLFQKIYYIEDIVAGIALLNEKGATMNQCAPLYEAVIKSGAGKDVLSVALNLLERIGLTPIANQDLYLRYIKTPLYAKKLMPAITALQDSGATFQQNKDLFLALINSYEVDRLSSVFKFLDLCRRQENGLTFRGIIKNAFHSLTSVLGFNYIPPNPVTIDDIKEIYLEVIKNDYNSTAIDECFALLNLYGFSIKNDKELFITVANKMTDINFGAIFFKIINLEKAPASLLSLVIKNVEDRDKVDLSMEQLEEQGFSISNDLRYYESALAIPNLSAHILKELGELGLSKKSHSYIYQLFFLQNGQPIKHPPMLLINLLHSLTDHLQINALLEINQPGYQAQTDLITKELERIIAQQNLLAQGPLEKSATTHELERILKKIVRMDIKGIRMRFDKTHGYLLQLADEPPIYINLLLDHVNFNHLDLSEELVEAIGNTIQEISESFKKDTMDETVASLPAAARYALSQYIGNKHYKNINRLFRGVAQIAEVENSWITPVNGTPNLLCNFLCGCLINWAAKELPLKHLEAKGGKIPDTSQYLLIRGENLTGSKELAVSARRLANPVISPSVTSVSVFQKGSPFFLNAQTTSTHFETPNPTRPVINSQEGEQLIPHGTSFIYTKNPDGGFFAKEVSSPDILPTGFYWSAVALSYASELHLKKQYSDAPSETTVNGVTIFRPNHGLAHTHRVMTQINVVKNYFALYAEDEEFRLFCQFMTEDEMQWLMVAAAFSITGRESELAAVENLQRYDEFRQASQEHFSAFLKVHPAKHPDARMQERMEHILRYMGNPAYEKAVEDKPRINQHPNEMEQKHRNFLHRILTTAHKLDLPRCYEPEQLERAMAACKTLSKPSAEQEQGYKNMLSYSVDLIKAHGNALQSGINEKGQFVVEKSTYQPPFERVSTNIRDLQAMTDSVTRPKMSDNNHSVQNARQEVVQYVLKMCGQESPEGVVRSKSQPV